MKGRFDGATAAALAAAAALFLSGCGESFRQTMGLGKRAPDETQVVEQAPLELPPDFNLRPPAPGAARPQEQEAQERAGELLFGADEEEDAAALAASRTPGERVLLNMAGGSEADPGIRQVVDREAGLFVSEDPGWVDRLMFWQSPEPVGDALDPVAESERLRENQEIGQGVTTGETPVIIRRERAPLEGLNPF